MNKDCQKCGKKLYSAFDRKYVDMFDQCWECDKQKWDDGELELETFEAREQIALNNIL